MIFKTKTFTNLGLAGYQIDIEADQNKALPTIEIIGLPDAAIKEAKQRIRATYRNSGIDLPRHKIILNLAPSHIRKEGTRFDLAMAMAILTLINDGNIAHHDKLDEYLFFGELGLDGSVKRVKGLLPSVISAIKKGYKHFFVPVENVHELEYIADITVYPLRTFTELANHFLGKQAIEPLETAKKINELYHVSGDVEVDFAQIKGHLVAKRALAIAAAGLHNVLMVGSPGCGKTMLAKATHGIIPPLEFQEALEVSQIYSLVGKLSKDIPLITQRPFRQVHHTASKISIVGGGRTLTPGEVSLAHKGILFFDEIPEFPREVLEVLRQPVEDKKVCISRVSGTVEYPCNFMFVGTMNPSPCGYYMDPEIPCKSTYAEIKRYQSRVSGPLMDRIDMILEIPRENIEKILDDEKGESSETIKLKVMNARKMQQRRYAGTNIVANAHLGPKTLEKYITIDEESKEFIANVVKRLHLSPRIIHRMLKLARTIADFDQCEQLQKKHIAEALQYRAKSMFVE